MFFSAAARPALRSDLIISMGSSQKCRQFPIMTFHGKMWAKCDQILEFVATCDKIWHTKKRALKGKYGNM